MILDTYMYAYMYIYIYIYMYIYIYIYAFVFWVLALSGSIGFEIRSLRFSYIQLPTLRDAWTNRGL